MKIYTNEKEAIGWNTPLMSTAETIFMAINIYIHWFGYKEGVVLRRNSVVTFLTHLKSRRRRCK